MEQEDDGKAEAAPEGLVGKLKQELSAEKKRNEDILTRMKYLQADLENQRKRTEREMREAGDSAARNLLSRLLVVQDELDLAAKHSVGENGGTLKEGIAMVRSNLWTALESAGLERIESVGKPFDPSVHEAVEKVQGSSPGEDMVVEEVRPGFRFRGQVLRPSMVKVELALKEAEQEANADE